MNQHKEMTGQRFGRLLVLSRGPNDSSGSARWHCQCDCGQEILTQGGKLRRSESRSCGCLRSELLATRMTEKWHTLRGDNPMHRTMKRHEREKAQATGKIDRSEIFDRDGGLCGICHQPVDPDKFDLDHVIPLIALGAHGPENVVLAHPTCNKRKGTRVMAMTKGSVAE